MNKTKPVVSIENWFLIANKLYGNVQNHPNFDDGTLVQTSTVITEPGEEPAKEGDTLETRNSFYLLGKAGQRDGGEIQRHEGR